MSYHSTMKHVKGDPLPDPVQWLPGGSPLYMAAPAGNIPTTAWLGNLGGRHRRWRGAIAMPHCGQQLGDPPLYRAIFQAAEPAESARERAVRWTPLDAKRPLSYVLGDLRQRERVRERGEPVPLAARPLRQQRKPRI